MALAVELFEEPTAYTCIASCFLGTEPAWSRDMAVVGGNTVRLFKLLSAFLDQVCQQRREASDILSRFTFETAATVRYLIANFSPELVSDYTRSRKVPLPYDRVLYRQRHRIENALPAEGLAPHRHTLRPMRPLLGDLHRSHRYLLAVIQSPDPRPRRPLRST